MLSSYHYKYSSESYSGLIPIWHHLQCFVDRADFNADDIKTLSVFSGIKDLLPEDIVLLNNTFKIEPPPSSGAKGTPKAKKGASSTAKKKGKKGAAAEDQHPAPSTTFTADYFAALG